MNCTQKISKSSSNNNSTVAWKKQIMRTEAKKEVKTKIILMNVNTHTHTTHSSYTIYVIRHTIFNIILRPLILQNVKCNWPRLKNERIRRIRARSLTQSKSTWQYIYIFVYSHHMHSPYYAHWRKWKNFSIRRKKSGMKHSHIKIKLTKYILYTLLHDEIIFFSLLISYIKWIWLICKIQ